ncbi:hypothetical protein [Streptomyces sp. NRRL B-3229]|uniref:hypothetical protein n=1 Tax=Streptomyces sp. NRRL B-3229 TaxID=1463836 RepID=UPI0004C20462|nr:hypothetical protein [Streptomyces sp. NRRL B-3229]
MGADNCGMKVASWPADWTAWTGRADLHVRASTAPSVKSACKRCLTVVPNQWEMAGHPVPRDWVDRVHQLIDARAVGDVYTPLLDEILDPPI